MGPKPVFLDVDSSEAQKKLLITEKQTDEEFNKLFGTHPVSFVVPKPAFCVKAKEVDTGTKVFLNVCYTDDVPPPNDISEEELVLICHSEELSSFKIPMSLGEISPETDKNGCAVKVSDVAIHPNFLKKIEESQFFKSFFIAVAFEGLKKKHNLSVSEERVILKNRKSYGTVQVHRIRQSDDYVENSSEANVQKYLNEHSQNKNVKSSGKPKIETISSVTYNEKCDRQPEYRMYRKGGDPQTLYAEFKLLKIMDANEVVLDVGEDRIILESKQNEYYLDVFIPFNVIQSYVLASFNRISKILTVTMPIQI